ncbi:MAG: phosphoglycerate kinase [Candidatus Doudnabacteria bacterium Gr01-1014_77]|uniref:Phosphoglycerate kinase n=1 Tax=Candidatus Doudnabacteria bacterium Gr01-1014_77 TaxID=2017133 RepID=A0A554JD88_9BACT|nr:MAG: phosphoglycerate kinase [Candidatus Doudnabacteria bacterium Gr01-1014_77]
MKFLSSQQNLSGKTVLLRADLDAPREGNKILDDSRIKASVPTIKYLIDQGAKIVIVSKNGRPKGWQEEYTLKPIAEYIAKLLSKNFVSAKEYSDQYFNEVVFFEGDITKEGAVGEVKKLSQKNIVILENIRFYKQEEEASPVFAKQLSSLGEIFVNDAFAMMHRNEASVSLIPKYLPSFAGLNVEKELNALNKLLTLKADPFIVIIGGAKISDKVGAIKNLGKSAEHVLVGGGPANLFFLAQGFEIGESLCEKQELDVAKDLMRNYKQKLVLPVDVVVAKAKDHTQARVCKPDQVLKDEAILDIGPQTTLFFSKIVKASKKMVWNGPMGLFEEKQFSHGTMSLALIFAARCKGYAYGVVGGGDTLDALNKAKVLDQIDFVSTAGGATLDFLAGENLPGLKALE